MEKIFADNSSKKGLILRICKEPKEAEHPKKNPIVKWTKELSRNFSKESITK
jgi:hypothetical protein